jgi:cardiolipin synthase
MASARDGVDVRMLVPGTTDIPVLGAVSRATYQPLLESGVRIFEWNGPMLHAKTAVADGRWARIGSSNMNISSWLGNYELDIAVDDADFALAMEEMYVEDLSLSTEIVLGRRNAAVPAGKRPWARRRAGEQRKGGIRRAGIGFIRAGRVVESAITNRRLLGPADTRIMSIAGLMLLGLASVALAWPRVLAVPVACMSAWLAEVLFMKAYRALYKSRTVSPPHSTPDVTQNR